MCHQTGIELKIAKHSEDNPEPNIGACQMPITTVYSLHLSDDTL